MWVRFEIDKETWDAIFELSSYRGYSVPELLRLAALDLGKPQQAGQYAREHIFLWYSSQRIRDD